MISIVMPVYNRSNKVGKAIESVIKQSYEKWELIVVDDYSTDDLFEVAQKYARKDQRIKVLKNSKMKGVSGARNCGMENASGEYIAFLDSDDQYLPNHLKDSYDVMKKYNQTVSFALWYEQSVNEQGEVRCDKLEHMSRDMTALAEQMGTKIEEDNIFFDRAYFERTCTSSCYCYQINTMVMKRSVWEKGFRFDEELHTSEDIDFITRIIFEEGFVLILRYHIYYNQGNDNLFFFLDRGNVNLEKLLDSKERVRKLINCALDKIRMYEKRISFLEQHKKELQMYGKCVKVANYLISTKYGTLAILNQRIDKYQSCIYMIQSLKYAVDDDLEWKKDFIRWVLRDEDNVYLCSLDKLNLY